MVWGYKGAKALFSIKHRQIALVKGELISLGPSTNDNRLT